jgi:hypothetical protein
MYRYFLIAIILLTGILSMSREHKAIVENVYPFEADGVTSLSQIDNSELQKLRKIIAFRSELNLNQWIVKHGRCRQKFYNAILDKTPSSHKLEKFLEGFPKAGGVFFMMGKSRILYEETRRRILDGYKYYLTYYDRPCHRKWKKRIPLMEFPVYPVITDKYILYVSSYNTPELIIVDRWRGKILEKYPLNLSESYTINVAVYPLHMLPYYTDGYVVFQDFLDVKSQTDGKWSRKKGKILVLKLQ